MSEPPALILASASPRRQELLREAGYQFMVHPSTVDEDEHGRGLLPADLAVHLALAKAQDVARQYPRDVVLAADTVVALGDMVLGKPADEADARQMLQLLSNTTHLVITGVAVLRMETGFQRADRAMSAVRTRAMTGAEIERYVAGGQWQGKAGGYGIQDPDPFVTCVSGSHSNIVGLPMELVVPLLAEAGITCA